MAKRRHRIVDNSITILKFLCCCVGEKERTPNDIYKVDGAAAGTSLEADQIGLTFGGKAVKFRDFHILRVLGRGSFAKVLMVEEKSTNQVFAMKVIKKQCADLSKNELIESVETERSVLGMAADCPFLVGLHGCFQSPSRLFFVIEFASGGDMISHTGRYGRLPEEHVRFYTAEISIALDFLHGRGVAYRDLKLDNILLDRDGHIKLTDYGVSKAGLQPGFPMTTFCGTLRYMSPELLRREKYGYSVDWWALGVVMYEMLVGKSPFDADLDVPNYEECVSEAILYGALETPAFMSGQAVSVLNGLLNKNPTERLGFESLQSHIFFCTTSWDMLREKQLDPPFKPQVKSDHDVNNFDQEFTKEPAVLTPDNSTIADAATEEMSFQGFEYDWETSENDQSICTPGAQDHCEQEKSEQDHCEQEHSEQDHCEQEHYEQDHCEQEYAEQDHCGQDHSEQEHYEQYHCEQEQSEQNMKIRRHFSEIRSKSCWFSFVQRSRSAPL